MENLDKPSIHFCETGELEENEIYNPEIHLFNENGRRRICEKAYPDLFLKLSRGKRYVRSMIHSNKKSRASSKRKKRKVKKRKTKKKRKKNN